MKALIYGNSNADITVKPVKAIDPSVDTMFVDHLELTNGGNAMTASFVLRRLGMECALATAIGGEDDYFSQFLLHRMEEAALDTSLVERVNGMSCGSVIVCINETGHRWFLYKKGVQNIQKLNNTVLERIPEFDIVSVNGTFLMPSFDGEGTLQLLKAAKEAGKTTVMDLTPDTSGRWLDLIGESLKYCDYFMPSDLEARGITGLSDPREMAHALYQSCPNNIIIKLGDRGCYYLNAESEGLINGFPIDTVDTTGAGDSFCAGFIYAISHNYKLREALRFANAVGAYSCMHYGATGGIQSIDDVFALIEKYS